MGMSVHINQQELLNKHNHKNLTAIFNTFKVYESTQELMRVDEIW